MTSSQKHFLLILAMAIWASCSSKEEIVKEVIRPVMYQKVVPGGGIQERTFSGTAIAGTETKMSFKVGGNIRSLRVKVGQEVNKNTLIATLDDSDLQLQYEQSDATVKNADALEEQTKSNFERVRTLYENGNLAFFAALSFARADS